MLKNYEAVQYKMEPDKRKALIKEMREMLAAKQQIIKGNKLPVMVLFEGWGAAGKGTLIGHLIQDMDPRFYHVVPYKPANEEQSRKPFLWRFMEEIPEQGKFVFYDSGWMEDTVHEMVSGRLRKKELENRFERIRIFERQLKDNGYLVIKLFLHITKKNQKQRIEKLLDSRNTGWRVGSEEEAQLKCRKKYEEAFDAFLEATHTEDIPWNVVDAADEKQAELQALCLINKMIGQAVENREAEPEILQKDYPLLTMPELDEVPLNQEMTEKEYNTRRKELQKRLKKLHNKLYRKGIPVVIAYEGWDAAGKGGNIKRLTRALDPRGFKVHPIAAPEPHEKARHYLWRFYHRLPKTGHVAIFDRTWYGRVMVERIEGFCSENEWKRAYNEINEFEQELSDWGAVVIKFWIHIDKDTQLARFEERQRTPEKQWKITEEDWRNREKWDEYESAVNEMIQRTSTKAAPWYIIKSNNKYFARIQAIQIVIEQIEKRLKEGN